MAQLQPAVQPNLSEPKVGFNRYVERLNGRAAMIGFASLLAIEYFTGQNPLTWLGLN
jgi:Chlorophyll A-B binding protein